eukprot:jgi/Botrbrau1/14101/Bobra.182_3s0045.1
MVVGVLISRSGPQRTSRDLALALPSPASVSHLCHTSAPVQHARSTTPRWCRVNSGYFVVQANTLQQSGPDSKAASSSLTGKLATKIGRASQRSRVVSKAAVMGHGLEVAGEEDFAKLLASGDVVVVDWMAKWCRKCIYLKPKLEKLMETEFKEHASVACLPRMRTWIPLGFVDVNNVPSTLVRGNDISKMPTISVFRRGEKVAEHVAAEGGLDAIDSIRRVIKNVLADASKLSTGGS